MKQKVAKQHTHFISFSFQLKCFYFLISIRKSVRQGQWPILSWWI